MSVCVASRARKGRAPPAGLYAVLSAGRTHGLTCLPIRSFTCRSTCSSRCWVLSEPTSPSLAPSWVSFVARSWAAAEPITLPWRVGGIEQSSRGEGSRRAYGQVQDTSGHSEMSGPREHQPRWKLSALGLALPYCTVWAAPRSSARKLPCQLPLPAYVSISLCALRARAGEHSSLMGPVFA